MGNSSSVPFFKGKDAKLILILGDDSKALETMSVDIDRVGTDIADPINGEDRDDLDFVTNHFAVSITGQQRKLEVLKAFLELQVEEDGRTIPKEKAGVFKIQQNDGTLSAFQLHGQVVVGAWKIGWKNRADRNSYTLPIRAQRCDLIPL